MGPALPFQPIDIKKDRQRMLFSFAQVSFGRMRVYNIEESSLPLLYCFPLRKLQSFEYGGHVTNPEHHKRNQGSRLES